ncbi:hypothetical protein GCM10027277_03860 [Pseudoduganella ginsengisoli]
MLSVSQTRSFSRSAEERGITQSALSKRIRALEQWGGADLVDRSSFPMALTPAGMLSGAAPVTAAAAGVWRCDVFRPRSRAAGGARRSGSLGAVQRVGYG